MRGELRRVEREKDLDLAELARSRDNLYDVKRIAAVANEEIKDLRRRLDQAAVRERTNEIANTELSARAHAADHQVDELLARQSVMADELGRVRSERDTQEMERRSAERRAERTQLEVNDATQGLELHRQALAHVRQVAVGGSV